MKRHLLILAVILPFLGGIAVCKKPTGLLTVVNQGSEPLKGTFNEEPMTVKPSKAWARKEVPQGEHELVIEGAKEPIKVTITPDLTTVVDPIGKSCYVVVDYRNQYGLGSSGEIKIVERIKAQKVFTPAKSLLVPFGRKLPSKVAEGTPVRRLHAVDCAIVEDAERIAAEITRIP